jgi:superfamily II DNA or RNA helicase
MENVETGPLNCKRPRIELRPYQAEAVEKVFASWSQFDRTLGIAPTGSGKTVKFAHVTERRLDAGRVLILAHRDELLDQAQDKLYQACGLISAKEKAADRADLDAGVVIGSVQTLARPKRLERFTRDHFATTIVDEAHHVLADSYQRILKRFDGAKVLGTTATPDRGDTRSLAHYFEDVAFQISLIDLIKDAYLCRIRVQTVPLTVDISNVSTRAGDFSDEELAVALEPVLEEAAEAILTCAGVRKTLIFVPLVRIASAFAEILRDHGVAAEMISGACADRAEKLHRFGSGETQMLVNAMLLTEGYDEPSIDCVVPLRPTKIRSLYAQQVGRGTRIHPGKRDLLILDFLWQSRRHDIVSAVDLVAADDNERAGITAALSGADGDEDGDLVTALTVSRERALARQIAAQRDSRGELMDLIDVCVAYRAPELETWAPTMRWHRLSATEKQLDFLARWKVDAQSVRGRGHASEIISAIIRHQESLPATPKQLGYLQHCLGYRGNLAGLSKPAASRLISDLKERLAC